MYLVLHVKLYMLLHLSFVLIKVHTCFTEVLARNWTVPHHLTLNVSCNPISGKKGLLQQQVLTYLNYSQKSMGSMSKRCPYNLTWFSICFSFSDCDVTDKIKSST